MKRSRFRPAVSGAAIGVRSMSSQSGIIPGSLT
jgi:hypothetical protein